MLEENSDTGDQFNDVTLVELLAPTNKHNTAINLDIEVLLVQQPFYRGELTTLYTGWTIFIIGVIALLVLATCIQVLFPLISKCINKRKREEEGVRSEIMESYDSDAILRDASAKPHRISIPDEIVTFTDVIENQSNGGSKMIDAFLPNQKQHLTSLEKSGAGYM